MCVAELGGVPGSQGGLWEGIVNVSGFGEGSIYIGRCGERQRGDNDGDEVQTYWKRNNVEGCRGVVGKRRVEKGG